MSKSTYNLFLDDLRNLQDAYDQEKHEMFLHKEWVVVKNYDEFVSYIYNNGLPKLIAFDHDLHEEHYTPKEYWNDYQESQKFQDSRTYTTKTGLDCAKFVIDYCEEYSQPLPEWYSHSANPIGRDRINDLMFYYNRYSNQSFNVEKHVILKKALMYNGQFVDEHKLFSGIYKTNNPYYRPYSDTIELMTNRVSNTIKGTDSEEEYMKNYINNINQCHLAEIEISFKI